MNDDVESWQNYITAGRRKQLPLRAENPQSARPGRPAIYA
jgi:hypothetical protein